MFLLFLTQVTFAQSSTFSTTDFLATARQHPHLKLHQNTLDYLKNTNHDLPILEKLEFRTETNDFKIHKQEYVLRFDFSTQKERAAQQGFHQNTIQYYATESPLLLENIMEERYEQIVDLYYQKRLIVAREQQKVLYQDKLFVLQKSIQTTDFDINELIETEEELAELEQDLLELQIRVKQLNRLIQQHLPNNLTSAIDTSTWPNVKMIQKRVQDSPQDSISVRPILAKRQAEIRQIKAAYELEKAQNQNLINYGQIKFAGGPELFQERVSLGIGILLPLKNANVLDLNELELEQLEASHQLKMEQDDLQQNLEKSIARMDLYLQQYLLLERQIKNSQTAYTLEQYSKIEGVSPLSLLKLKELLLKKEWTILKIEYQLFQSYIKYLALSGRMMTLPLQNYLSRNLEKI